MQKKLLEWILLMLISVSMFSWSFGSDPTFTYNRFMSSTSREIEQQYGVETVATGGSFVGGVSWIKFTFLSDAMVNMPDARRMLVEITENVRKRTQASRSLRKYLASDPLPIGAFEILLDYQDCKHCVSDQSQRNIALAILVNGNVVFESYDENTRKYHTQHKESYEEALRIVSE